MLLHTTVAVLGAGWAGISACSQLSKHGIDDFLLVEGGKHIGGRTRKKTNFGDGNYTIEDGSNWIQGVGNIKKGHANPVWELATKYGLEKIKKKKHPFNLLEPRELLSRTMSPM
jgi:monoamine oxidase